MSEMAATPSRAAYGPLAHGAEAYWLLRIGFGVLPIIAGIDKFFNRLVDWPMYLAGWIADLFNVSAQTFMYGVGVIEIVAGIGVLLFPSVFAYIVCAWLIGIIINLLTIPGHFDIALRDLGLAIGALALARLSHDYPRRHVDQRNTQTT